jgi:hypothetical protein
MSYSTTFYHRLAWAALSCAVVTICAAQERNPAQSAPSVEASASSSSAAPFEVAPGIALPAKGVVWILDQSDNRPELVRIYHNSVSNNSHRGENLARAQFFLKQVTTVELPGIAAKLRVNSRSPAIFVRKSMEEEDELQSDANGKSAPARYALLRMRVVEKSRVLYYYSFAQFSRKPTRHEDEIEGLTEEVSAGQWIKITPKDPLPDGEYAVVLKPDDKNLIDSFAYDFGIGPATARPATH